mmetsp:Transcript_7551/g.19173  ORF Transcript_7551/g.19173 Transcript_7551/m.19173 type:complete len:290 (+) Transcript_7551:331-1200(+)
MTTRTQAREDTPLVPVTRGEATSKEDERERGRHGHDAAHACVSPVCHRVVVRRIHPQDLRAWRVGVCCGNDKLLSGRRASHVPSFVALKRPELKAAKHALHLTGCNKFTQEVDLRMCVDAELNDDLDHAALQKTCILGKFEVRLQAPLRALRMRGQCDKWHHAPTSRAKPSVTVPDEDDAIAYLRHVHRVRVRVGARAPRNAGSLHDLPGLVRGKRRNCCGVCRALERPVHRRQSNQRDQCVEEEQYGEEREGQQQGAERAALEPPCHLQKLVRALAMKGDSGGVQARQ